MEFFEELKRRNVIRVGIAYLVTAWLIVQIVETLFPVYGLSDGAIRLVVTVLAIGLPPTLVFAWVFERTSEGIKRQKDVDRSVSITPQTGRRLDRAIIVVLVLAVAYFAWDKFVARTPAPPAESAAASPALDDWNNRRVAKDRKAIAVLPFTNMSGDQANEPFTLGIHDDLLTHLSRIDALKTTSRTSVLQYRGTTKTIPEIGAELDVAYILEGGIQRAGDRVRINMQLIDAANDEHLWAEIYDRQLSPENLFAVQADVAEAVTRSLEATLLPAEREALDDTPTQSMAAYDLYLLGRHHQFTRNRESLERAVDYYTRAVEEDPEYVLAYAGLAQAYLLLADYNYRSGAEVIPEAEAMIERAMALDDSVSAVWAARGLAAWDGDNDNPAAIEAFERAIELDQQNYQAWLWYARALWRARRFEEELEALEVAYSLEPMSEPVNNNLGNARRWRGDFARAREHFRRVDQVDGRNESEWMERIARTYLEEGDLDRAVVAAREVVALDPSNLDVMEVMIRVYAELGDLAEARRWVDERDRASALVAPVFSWYIARGDFDGLLALMENQRAAMEASLREGVDADGPFLVPRFLAAYFGRREETARSSLDALLASRGGRMETNPYLISPTTELAVADFLLHHGERSAGGAQRGAEMAEEIRRSLEALSQAGYEHPDLWFCLSLARTLVGDLAGGREALQTAVSRGFSSRLDLEHHPALDALRDDPAFGALVDRVETRLAAEREQLAAAELAPYRPAGERPRIVLSRDVMENYAGYYTDGNQLLHFFVDETGEFMFQGGVVTLMPMVPIAENRFHPKIDESVSIEFVTDDTGAVMHAEITNRGEVRQLNLAAPPPETVTLDPGALAAFAGTWAAERVRGASGGAADRDTWTAVISVDGQNGPTIDFDDQPPLPIAPISERAFITPGFVNVFEFEDLDGDGVFDRMVSVAEGREMIFERQ